MSFEITGELHKIFETENKTETFQARDFVIKTEGSYPQYIKFQLTQERCGLIEPFEPGDPVKVSFDLRGREWNDKYFTNLNAWKIERNEPETEAVTDRDLSQDIPPLSDAGTDADEVDDLPF